MSNTPYVRQERVNRQTGTTIVILDLAHPDSGFDPNEAGRWATICDEHGTIITHDTLALARHHAPDPLGWCEVCMDLSQHGGTN